MDLYKHFRTQLRSLSSFDLHKKLIHHYISHVKTTTRKYKRDIDIIRENHKFLWDDDEEPNSWEEELAKKYYDRLYKEYCICDLTYYKEGKVALRWQIEAELISGKGQFICGDKNCNEAEALKTWEVNFGYVEQGEKKNALVKLRLCTDCSYKLNYKHKRKEIKRIKKLRRKHGVEEAPQLDEDVSTKRPKIESDQSPSSEEETTAEEESAVTEENEESSVWTASNKVVEEKSREQDFEDFLEQLLL